MSDIVVDNQGTSTSISVDNGATPVTITATNEHVIESITVDNNATITVLPGDELINVNNDAAPITILVGNETVPVIVTVGPGPGPRGQQGEPGEQGEQGEPGVGSASFYYDSAGILLASHVINHNLGFFPNVSAFNQPGGQPINGVVIHHSVNQLEIQFNTVRSITAMLT